MTMRRLLSVLLLLFVPLRAFAVSGTCSAPTVIPGGGTPTAVTGTTTGSSALVASCVPGNTAAAPEAVFKWTPSTSGVATIETCGGTTNFDTVIYMRTV